MNDRTPMDLAAWLTALIRLCNPADPAAEIDGIGHMAPFIAGLNLPAWAFCAASAVAVEAYDRRRAVPSFSEIERPLRGWMERNSQGQSRTAADIHHIDALREEDRLRHMVALPPKHGTWP